jgi:hypothetical protein
VSSEVASSAVANSAAASFVVASFAAANFERMSLRFVSFSFLVSPPGNRSGSRRGRTVWTLECLAETSALGDYKCRGVLERTFFYLESMSYRNKKNIVQLRAITRILMLLTVYTFRHNLCVKNLIQAHNFYNTQF